MAEIFDDATGYQLVYQTASWFVRERERALRPVDPESVRDFQYIRLAVALALKPVVIRINPAIAAEAITDAMHRRTPRW